MEILAPAKIMNESLGGAAIELPGDWQVRVGAVIDLSLDGALKAGAVRHATPTADGNLVIGIEWIEDDGC